MPGLGNTTEIVQEKGVSVAKQTQSLQLFPDSCIAKDMKVRMGNSKGLEGRVDSMARGKKLQNSFFGWSEEEERNFKNA